MRHRPRWTWTYPITPLTYATLFAGGKLLDYWHSEQGIALQGGEVDTWTGQFAGLVATAAGAVNRPTYAADPGFFNNKIVVQTWKTLTGNVRQCRYIPGGTIWPATQRPCLITVSRYRTQLLDAAKIGTTSIRLADMVAGVNGSVESAIVATAVGGNLAVNYGAGSISTAAAMTGIGLTDTRLEVWQNARRVAFAANPANYNVAGPITGIGFGSQAQTATNVGDTSLAMVFALNSMPTEYEWLQLYELAKAEWGI